MPYKLSKRGRAKRLAVEKRGCPGFLKRLSVPRHLRRAYRFVRENGYIILPRAVNTELCDELASYYDLAMEGRLEAPPFCEYFDESGNYFYGAQFRGNNLSSFKGVKILDLYAHSQAARAAMFSPKIIEMLALIFDSSVLAFQQLGMIHGTQQPLHQDTAYVRVSSPALIAASWIALEDVRPGSGELELIPASHFHDSFRFNSMSDQWCCAVEKDPSRSVWWGYQDTESHDQFLQELENLKQELGSIRYLPLKGDCLIWISFLAHGGSPVEPRFGTIAPTRKSLVTHYCPWPNAHPLYFHQNRFLGPEQHSRQAWYAHKL